MEHVDGSKRRAVMLDPLPSWSEGATKEKLIAFIEAVARPGSASFVPLEERVAVFDNDGTLWCEKPLPNELAFILERFAAMAERDASLRQRQPWKAAYERDYHWLANAITQHYRGDDTDVKQLIGAILPAFEGMTVTAYEAAAYTFLQRKKHPALGRSFRDCAYQPMVDLLRYLESRGFSNFIASAGDRDFMRPIAQQIYGVPSERVIGSSKALRYQENDESGVIRYCGEPDVFDDGAEKPVRIWSRVGRRPLLAAGNSNGDIPMLQFAGDRARTSLRLLVLHDDPTREFAYTAGAERALELAESRRWTIASIQRDWTTVFVNPR
jgi:phosphoserine phosphatase